jgi:hypothetical protein
VYSRAHVPWPFHPRPADSEDSNAEGFHANDYPDEDELLWTSDEDTDNMLGEFRHADAMVRHCRLS